MSRQFTLQKKLSISFVALTLVTTAVLSLFLYITFSSRFRKEIKHRMLTTVSLVALQIDAKKHNSLKVGDEKSSIYLYQRKKLQKARGAGSNIRYVYTMRMNKDNKIMFVIDAEEDNPDEIAHLGDIYNDASDLLKSKFATMSSPIVEEGFYTDKWGTWITAYAPFYTDDGRRAGVVGMDISIDYIRKQEKIFLFICLAVFLCIALPASIFGWLLGYRLMLPLAALKKQLAGISMDNLEQPMEIYKHNEMGELASEFNKMALNLNHSITMLKKSQEELEYFKKIIDFSTNAVAMSTPEGKYNYQNMAYNELFGITVEEIEGEFGPESAVYVDESVGHEVLTTVVSGKSWEGEVKMYGRNRKIMDIYLKAYSIKNAQNKIIYLIGIHTDITERKKYEYLLKKKNIEIDNAHKHAIYMLAVASEYKDQYTGNHVKNIAQITTELALEMGIDTKLADRMGHDSILHDLGKLGIPDSILLKPGKLTEDEFEIIKQHTLLGAKIIGDDEWFRQARQIAMSHHEKWNGCGYPKGLKNDGIPFAARIVAVVDVFDALISERPYKKTWSLKKAVEEIKREAGKHFDPKIAEAFLSLYKKGKLEKYV